MEKLSTGIMREPPISADHASTTSTDIASGSSSDSEPGRGSLLQPLLSPIMTARPETTEYEKEDSYKAFIQVGKRISFLTFKRGITEFLS